jgi:phosphoglycolate phosphatase
MNIFIDLDGTLINSHQRLYDLFQYLVPESSLSFEGYWNFKRNQISHEVILKKYYSYSEAKLHNFLKLWMLLIEDKKYLNKDTVIFGSIDALKRMNNSHNLYICTSRQSQPMAVEQIIQLGLMPFFKDVLVTGLKLSKSDLIERACIPISQKDWIIGDTGKDIETGKYLKINTCAVESGFTNADKLRKYAPNIILNSIIDFPNTIFTNEVSN